MDGSSYTVEKSLAEHKSKISQEVVDEVENAIREAREAVNSEDLDRMNQAKTNLDNASMKIGQAVYSQGSTSEGNTDSQSQEGQQEGQSQEGEQKEGQEGEQKDGEKKN